MHLRVTPFPLADANGNAVTYLDEAGNVQAHYVYDAFGGTVSQSGDMTDSFRFRFSSKYLDDETGLYYYGYRYYSPATGRWFSRDPVEEDGGYNLYGFIVNDGVNKWDFLGEAHGCNNIKGDQFKSILDKLKDCLDNNGKLIDKQVRKLLRAAFPGKDEKWIRHALSQVKKQGKYKHHRRSGGKFKCGGAVQIFLLFEITARQMGFDGVDWFDWRLPKKDATCTEVSTGCWKCKCPKCYGHVKDSKTMDVDFPSGCKKNDVNCDNQIEWTIKSDTKPKEKCIMRQYFDMNFNSVCSGPEVG